MTFSRDYLKNSTQYHNYMNREIPIYSHHGQKLMFMSSHTQSKCNTPESTSFRDSLRSVSTQIRNSAVSKCLYEMSKVVACQCAEFFTATLLWFISLSTSSSVLKTEVTIILCLSIPFASNESLKFSPIAHDEITNFILFKVGQCRIVIFWFLE